MTKPVIKQEKEDMANFSKFKQIELTAESRYELTLPHIAVNGVHPVLILAPAMEVNKPYFNAQIKRTSKTIKKVQKGFMDSSMIEDGRSDDRDLYPRYVIKGWKKGTMLDHETGKDIQFTQKVCEEFVAAIPDHVFDYIREGASNESNFTDAIDVEAVAGN